MDRTEGGNLATVPSLGVCRSFDNPSDDCGAGEGRAAAMISIPVRLYSL